MRPSLALPLVALLACTSVAPDPEPSGLEGAASTAAGAPPPPVVRAALSAFDAEVARRRAAFAAESRGQPDWRRVRARLEHMVALDQYLRSYAQSDIVVRFDAEERRAFDAAFLERWRSVDGENTRVLKQLLDEHGWFTISAFGPRADRDAWLLVQHADHDVPFQREVLARLGPLAESGETDPRNYAYLHDRVAVAEGRPQRYGTQGRCVGEGRWAPHPIEDEANVDRRRAEVGLGTMEEYVARFVELCG